MLVVILKLCLELGVELKPKKIFPPKPVMEVLGLTYDLIKKKIFLSGKKKKYQNILIIFEKTRMQHS